MIKQVWLISLFLLTSLSVLASESSLYDFSWLDKDKEIYVLQNRRFRKAGKAYVSALGAKTISGAFIDAYGGSARAGYFFREDWGVEAFFGKSTGQENDAAKGVEDQQAEAFYRKVDTYMGAMAMWSPFYSKINTFNKVFYYDWMFGLGLASVKFLDNRGEFAAVESKSLTSNNGIGLVWNTGLRIYISDHWSLRVDFTGLHVKPDKESIKDNGNTGNSVTTSDLFNNYDLGLGLNDTF
jgi:outer membrane beta-barrel protein